MAENTVKELKEYFSTPEKPVAAAEMMAFWKSMDEKQREYYKTIDLTTVK
jgi:hypothetical protein